MLLLKLILHLPVLCLANTYSPCNTQLIHCLLQEAFPDCFPLKPTWVGCLLWVSTSPRMPLAWCGHALLGNCLLHLMGLLRTERSGWDSQWGPQGGAQAGAVTGDWTEPQPTAWGRCWRRRKGSPRPHRPPQGCAARPEAARSHSRDVCRHRGTSASWRWPQPPRAACYSRTNTDGDSFGARASQLLQQQVFR